MHITCKYCKVALEVAMTGLQPPEAVTVGAGPLTAADVIAVARQGAPVALASTGLTEIRRSREIVESLADDAEPHYGISTGFGALATRHIPADLRAHLQSSLVRSHAAGSGPEVENEVVRALMLLRLATLATGRTGAREETVQAYAALLNSGLTPVVHEYGSLGCSGDLAPLAHCALAITGEGVVRDAAGRTLPAGEALAAAGIKPVRLRVGGQSASRRCSAPTPRSPPTCRRCGRTLVRLRRRPICAPCWPAARSWPATAARSAPGCRTRTRCAARRRSLERCATPSITRPWSQAGNWHRRSTTR
jgi:hypothetical protein